MAPTGRVTQFALAAPEAKGAAWLRPWVIEQNAKGF
jgi:hypothetical protein